MSPITSITQLEAVLEDEAMPRFKSVCVIVSDTLPGRPVRVAVMENSCPESGGLFVEQLKPVFP